MVRAAKRRELVPTTETPDLSGRELVAHIGSQTARVPVEFLVAYFTKQLRGIEDWKKTAEGLDLVLYTGIRQSLNILIPIVREFMKRRPPVGFPQMPERPRHSDPVIYLLGYMNACSIDLLTRGEFTIPVDESGTVTDFEWSYLDDLRAQIEQARARQADSDALPGEEDAQ
jgi:hypothetical protein